MSSAIDRAIDRGDAAGAWQAAARLERGTLNLDRALALVVLVSPTDPGRYEAAAARWLQRWTQESRPSARTRTQLQQALSGLPSLEGVTELSPLAAAFGWHRAKQALERLYPAV